MPVLLKASKGAGANEPAAAFIGTGAEFGRTKLAPAILLAGRGFKFAAIGAGGAGAIGIGRAGIGGVGAGCDATGMGGRTVGSGAVVGAGGLGDS